MNVRLYTVSETALAEIRTRTFRHIHDLSMLHQQAERRGSLVARVTTDVDQISQFLQWGGVILLVTTGQLVITTIVMAIYSWQLTLVVWVAFLPLVRGHPGLPEAAVGALHCGPRADRRDARPRSPRASSARASSGRTACRSRTARAGSTTPIEAQPAGAVPGPADHRGQLQSPASSRRRWPPPAPSSSACTSASAGT